MSNGFQSPTMPDNKDERWQKLWDEVFTIGQRLREHTPRLDSVERDVSKIKAYGLAIVTVISLIFAGLQVI